VADSEGIVPSWISSFICKGLANLFVGTDSVLVFKNLIAIGHDLDLNLRICQPNVSSPKKSDNPMGVQYHFRSFEASEAKKARVITQFCRIFGIYTVSLHVQMGWN